MTAGKVTPSASVRQDVHNSDVPVLCRACEARHRGVCGALTPTQLLQLSRHASRHEFGAGTELVAAGEQTRRYANILSGVVKLTKLMLDGRQQIVGLQFAPDFLGRPFGESSDVSAEAAGTVRLCTFPKAAFEKVTEQSPGLEHRLHQQALRELDEARDWMMALGRKTASERVASFLLYVARHVDPEREPESGAVRFDVSLTRADIADFLGLTIETVSRQLTRLRKAGLIDIEKHRQVTVRDVDALEDAAGA